MVMTKVVGNFIPYEFVHYRLYVKVNNKRDNAIIKFHLPFSSPFKSKSKNIDPRAKVIITKIVENKICYKFSHYHFQCKVKNKRVIQ